MRTMLESDFRPVEYGDHDSVTFHWPTGSGTFTRPKNAAGSRAMLQLIKELNAKRVPFRVSY